jgi:hypothetical protein
MSPLKYESLRDAQRVAAEEQQRHDDAERSREAAQEKIQAQAREQVELEKAKRFEWQKSEYAQRQREEATNQERSEKRDAYLKEHDPVEYARQERDKQLRADRQDQDPMVKRQWAERGQGELSAREQPDRTLEKGDAAQQREANKWQREMSDDARAAVERSQRDDQERERDRSDR